MPVFWLLMAAGAMIGGAAIWRGSRDESYRAQSATADPPRPTLDEINAFLYGVEGGTMTTNMDTVAAATVNGHTRNITTRLLKRSGDTVAHRPEHEFGEPVDLVQRGIHVRGNADPAELLMHDRRLHDAVL